MGTSRPLGVALVGAGMVAGTHVDACAAAQEHVRLLGIASRSGSSAADLARKATDQTGRPVTTYANMDEIARDDRVDFAIVVTPPDARQRLIAPLVAAGKHILLEKPVGRTADEARAVVDLCREAGVHLGIVFQHRMRAASLKAAELVASGTLGPLGYAEFHVPWWRDQDYYDQPGRGTYARDGGGVLMNQAIHTIDLGLHLTGPVARVRAMTATTRFHDMEAEDTAVAGLEFQSGAIGTLVASTAAFPGRAESITLHFAKASLNLQAGCLRVDWRDGRQQQFGAQAATGGGADPMAFTHEWHQAILTDFADAIRSGRPPAVTGESAMAAHNLIDAITTSARSGDFTQVPT